MDGIGLNIKMYLLLQHTIHTLQSTTQHDQPPKMATSLISLALSNGLSLPSDELAPPGAAHFK